MAGGASHGNPIAKSCQGWKKPRLQARGWDESCVHFTGFVSLIIIGGRIASKAGTMGITMAKLINHVSGSPHLPHFAIHRQHAHDTVIHNLNAKNPTNQYADLDP